MHPIKKIIMKKVFIPLIAIASVITIMSCSKDDDNNGTGGSGTTTVPAIYDKIYGATDKYVDGNFIVIKTTSLPDHKSPYYQGTTWASTKYEAYNGSNGSFMLNPNRIAQVNLTFRIPLNPSVASTHAATPGGPIGVSLNGVPFFNQYAAMNAPLTNEINTFDQYNGHPQQQGQYHYHIEPVYLTATKGSAALLGFLLDGFPVYGPMENAAPVTNAMLDVYHGHTSVTADYPNGIYHYHITSADPYLNGSGFYGTAGTVTQ